MRKKISGFSAGFLVFLALALSLVSCAMEDEPVRYALEQKIQTDGADETDETSEENENSGIGEATDELDEEEEEEESEELPVPAFWTFLVYMAADNELESSGIADINEMENVDFSDDVNVLVLFDRAPGYDSTNGDWTGTRLYKIAKDENVNKSQISSERLPCEELEISSESETELDMGNKAVLSGFLKFARREFPSENLGLIIWGHGSGWRGFSEDDTNSSSLSLQDLRLGIEDGMEGGKLDFLGFDTCFGTTLEAAYEMKDCAKIMAGTPGIVDDGGWNYELLFSDFFSGNETVEELSSAVQSQFEKTYAEYKYGAFCVLNLDEIESLFASFSEFSEKAASKITSMETRNKIFASVESGVVSYQAASAPTDFYADILSLEKTVSEILTDDEVSLAARKLEESLNSAIVSSWNAAGGSSLCVYFGYYKSTGVFSLSHDSFYINGSRESGVCRFVSSGSSYVPTKKKSGSLLDKLFYTVF